MKHLPAISRALYGLGITGLGVQQFIYPDFRPVIIPAGWPSVLHASPIWAYLVGAILIITGLLITLGKKTAQAALLLGGLLLLFFFAFQAVFLLFFGPYSPKHFGLWTDPLKESALAGGAFIVAGLFPDMKGHFGTIPAKRSKMLILIGSILFAITMIVFGIDHFLYTDFVATLVPAWIPGKIFWTYFGAVALIGSGVAIITRIALRPVAMLLGIMLILWVILLHIPRAIADPYGANGNEITSVFEAVAFAGIAFIISRTPKSPKVRESGSPKD